MTIAIVIGTHGWAASHSLEGAKTIAQAFLDKREQWNDIYGEGK